MSAPPQPPNLDPSALAQNVPEVMRDAYLRYLQGFRAVVESYDVAVGMTPKDPVWSLNKTKLYRYRPAPSSPDGPHRAVPLLMVYALINKPYIFDLRPERSFVEYLVGRGFDVFLLDWGSPGPEDRHTTFDDYAVEYLPRAVRKMLRITGAREFNLLGYCIGATLATVYAVSQLEAPIRNLVLLTPPLDFTRREESLFGRWLAEGAIDIDRFVDALGNVPAEIIEAGSKMLKPVENYVGTYASLWEKLDDDNAVENWQAMHKWVHDGVPFAGEAFRQWIKDYLRANRLFRGEHVVRGRRISLADLRMPLLNVVAKFDHIVPPPWSLSLMDAVSSRDKRLEIIPAGHVGIMAGKGARHQLWPLIADWLQERSLAIGN